MPRSAARRCVDAAHTAHNRKRVRITASASATTSIAAARQAIRRSLFSLTLSILESILQGILQVQAATVSGAVTRWLHANARKCSAGVPSPPRRARQGPAGSGRRPGGYAAPGGAALVTRRLRARGSAPPVSAATTSLRRTSRPRSWRADPQRARRARPGRRRPSPDTRAASG